MSIIRQVVLDTETTGLEPTLGHRIIEIGCVEVVGRRITGNRFHCYLNPDRDIDAGAQEVHGITAEFLADKPHFHDVAEDLLAFIKGAELVIHNAPFDVGFMNAELGRLAAGHARVEKMCAVLDTLTLARQLHPGQKNNLDALCRRYGIDNSQRDLHGALLDAEILADVYLAMTGGQASLSLDSHQGGAARASTSVRPLDKDRPPLRVIRAGDGELQAHREFLEAIDKTSGGQCLWRQMEPEQ